MRGERLRAVGPWVVWVCTGLVLISIPVSFFVSPGVSVMYESSNAAQTIQPYALGLSRGSIVYQSTFTFDGVYPGGPKNPGWRGSLMWHSIYYQPWARGATWWRPRWIDGWPMGLQVDFPLAYAGALCSLWSFVLIRDRCRRRRLGTGSCGGCGYSLAGLDGGVCPECGAGVDDAAS